MGFFLSRIFPTYLTFRIIELYFIMSEATAKFAFSADANYPQTMSLETGMKVSCCEGGVAANMAIPKPILGKGRLRAQGRRIGDNWGNGVRFCNLFGGQ